MKGLSKRQSEVLTYIERYIETHRFSPSYREIMLHFKLASVSSIAKMIAILKKKGALTGEKQHSRSIRPTEALTIQRGSSGIKLPYIGQISLNNKIEFFSKDQSVTVSDFLVKNPDNTYVLRAQGNSLNDEMIIDGDLLLIEGRIDCNDGDTILGTTSEFGIILRQYHPEGNYIRLCSRSPDMPPLIVRQQDFTLQGVLVALLRCY